MFFQLSLDQFFGYIPGANYPDSLGSELMSFYTGVQDIMTKEEFENYQREQFEKMKMNDDQQLSIDLELIDNYLKENNINAIKTESGLRYVVEKDGEGRNAAPGDNVSVHYTGMLLSGEVFDSSQTEVNHYHLLWAKAWLLRVGTKVLLILIKMLKEQSIFQVA